jgi:hypothetical protein
MDRMNMMDILYWMDCPYCPGLFRLVLDCPPCTGLDGQDIQDMQDRQDELDGQDRTDRMNMRMGTGQDTVSINI